MKLVDYFYTTSLSGQSEGFSSRERSGKCSGHLVHRVTTTRPLPYISQITPVESDCEPSESI